MTTSQASLVAADGLSRAAAGIVLPSFAGPELPAWMAAGLADGLAGVLLFGCNVVDPDQLARLSAQLRDAGDDPVVAIDEEGGDVTRLAHATGSPYPGNAALGAADDPALTRAVHHAMGCELAQVGVTLDLAPSVDVNTAADNPIIGTRSFGADPDLVARHAAAAVAGLHDAGVAACVKHFPGHGATREDSHLGVPEVDVSLEVLHARELVPFRAAVAAGARCVMSAHIRIPALTGPVPATLSPAALQGLLRDELGFDGVLLTDALDMRGASGGIGIPEAATRAFAAGADLLCLGSEAGPEIIAATVTAVADAVRDGRVPARRLEQAHERIATLRRRPARSTPADVAAGARGARAALQLRGRLPRLHRPVVAQLDSPATIAAGPVPWGIAPWWPGPVGGGEVVAVDETGPGPDALLRRATDRSLVVVARDVHRHGWMAQLIDRLVTARPDTVIVEMGLPIWRPRAGAHLATHGAARANADAALELLGALSPPP